MTTRTVPIFGDHYIDSGPIFCLGTSAILAELYDSLFRTKMNVVEAVAAEINRKADEMLRIGGPKSGGYVRKAARTARHRYGDELKVAVARPDPVPAMLAKMEAEVHTEGEHELMHRGECESILAAHATSFDFLTNDGGAGRLAGRHGVSSATFVEVMRQALKHDRLASRDDVARDLISAKKGGVDTGEHIRSALDL